MATPNDGLAAQGKPEVWTFFQHGPPKEVQQIVEAVRAECTRREWTFRPTRHQLHRSSRRNLLLPPATEIVEMYARMHRTRVCVLSVQRVSDQGPHIARRRSVEEALNVEEAAVSLRLFCLYKAFFRRLRTNRELGAWAGGFARWCTLIECDGRLDPRCLPLHVFNPHFRRGLQTAAGRTEFETRHQHHADRRDALTQIWKGRGPDHAKMADVVAGRELDRGLHWDVSDLDERPFTLHTPLDEWLVLKGGYINVYPSANVRANRGKAKKKEAL